jgi:hypothetical protein
MFKKAFIVVAAVAAMALPAAALGDGGTPAPDPGAKVAAAQATLQALKAKCDSTPAAAARCAKVAANVLDRLNKISARIDTMEGKINSKCSVANPPAKCSQAPAMLQKLDAAKQAISQLESWIQANFSTSAPAAAPAAQ